MLLLLLFLSVSAEEKGPLPPDTSPVNFKSSAIFTPSEKDDFNWGPLSPTGERRRSKVEESEEEDEEEEEEEDRDKRKASPYYEFLYKRMKEDAKTKVKKRPFADVYKIPGPQEPLPGRSHTGDYWPVFPFQNQYSGGLDLDPSISRHIGGDLNLAVPSWGMLDIYGRFFNRIRDTTTKFGYLNHPVNMLDLDRNDFVKLMSDPSLHWNRNAHPRLPLGKLARTYVPLNCKPPLCNPYSMTFGLGIEHDYGGNDGVEGDIDVPIPVSKGVAYRLPFSGKIYYALENITITYGQNLAPIDPMHSMFDYQYTRDPNLAIPRDRRDTSHSTKVWQSEPEAKTFAEHVSSGGRGKTGPFRTGASGQTPRPSREEGEAVTRTVAVPYFVPDFPPYPFPPYELQYPPTSSYLLKQPLSKFRPYPLQSFSNQFIPQPSVFYPESGYPQYPRNLQDVSFPPSSLEQFIFPQPPVGFEYYAENHLFPPFSRSHQSFSFLRTSRYPKSAGNMFFLN